MLTVRTSLWPKCLIVWLICTLVWLQVGPAFASAYTVQRYYSSRDEWRQAHSQHATLLRKGTTDTPSPATLKAVEARQAALLRRSAQRVTRKLTLHEMSSVLGRGIYRNPYFDGSPMPWQKSFHDVNVCTGNLFKSFTDFQVSPGRGAGLVMQRTYNSNDARVGPFGVGWTHAYDIRIQEAPDVQAQSGNPSADGSMNDVPRTDFFGAKHVYHRDADGLYTPPNYMFDQLDSTYDTVLANGPTKIMADTDRGMDGTVKHYKNIVTLANGTEANERACDSITDRYGNQTVLTYGQTITQGDGSARQLLTKVTDPTGRSLVYTWQNVNTTSTSATQPAWRITQAQGPMVGGNPVASVTYTVAYSYYTSTTDPNAADDLYNLQSVTVDPTGLSRTTSYTYTHVTDANGVQENALLSSITDPMGEVVSYSYVLNYNVHIYVSYIDGTITGPTPTGTVWVYQITEPAGVDSSGNQRTYTWSIINNNEGGGTTQFITDQQGLNIALNIYQGQLVEMDNDRNNDDDGLDQCYGCGVGYDAQYDADGNLTSNQEEGYPEYYDSYPPSVSSPGSNTDVIVSQSTYGQHGNQLTCIQGGFTGQETTTWYNASQYFQKSSDTDALGHLTSYGVGASTAGTSGDPDANPGDRGNILWVQDPGYNDSTSPSYHKQYAYTYNQYGQKASETNLSGTVTQYTYGDGYGNLTQVVQDAGSGHLNRTTTMTYDVAGRVLSATDPAGNATVTTYNVAGQPLTVKSYLGSATTGTLKETISYVYDENGRTSSVTDNRGTTSIAYEPGCDRVHSVTDSVTGTISYTYLPSGERASMTLPGGGTWNYSYYDAFTQGYLIPKFDLDSETRSLQSITDDAGRLVNYQADGRGFLDLATSDIIYSGTNLVNYLSCVRNAMEGDSKNPASGPSTPTGIGVINGTVEGSCASTGGLYSSRNTYTSPDSQGDEVLHFICENDYSYDSTGINRTANKLTSDWGETGTSSTRTEQYGYDDLNRLSSVDYGDGETQGYGFDPMGNRLTKTDAVTASGATTTTTTKSSFDAANRLTGTSVNGASATAVTSDADGNTLSDASGRSYTWDTENRMTSCTYQGATTTYTYGADGLRRSMTANGVTTEYAYDGATLIREFQAATTATLKSGQTLGSYYPSATYFVGPRGPEYKRNDNTGAVRWYLYDGLGSVIGEVDPSGNVTHYGTFDVYGAPRAGASGGTATSGQGFVGGLDHVTDASTDGLVYMQARYYDPGTGRFVSEDPSKNGANWFSYAMDAPTDFVDSTGRSAESLSDALLGEHIAIATCYFSIMEPVDPEVSKINVDSWAVKFSNPTTPDTIISAVLWEQSQWLLVCASSYNATSEELGGDDYAIEQKAVCAEASTQLRELRALLYIDDDSLPTPDNF